MKTRPVLLSVALAAALSMASLPALAASEPDPGQLIPVDAIEGITWQLQQQAVEGALTAIPDGVTVTLIMNEGLAGGTGGCNQYWASYTRDGDALAFSDIGHTLMHCEGPGGEVETVYLANLAAVAAGFSTGGSLLMADAAGETILEFLPAPESGIAGSWVAAGINNGAGGVETTAITPLVTAEFLESGDLTGFDGCNRFMTSYTLDGEAISIAPEILSTKMACMSEALNSQSQQFRAALIASTAWAVGADGALELRDDSGALQVRFVAAAA